jgi:hypothetical protein
MSIKNGRVPSSTPVAARWADVGSTLTEHYKALRSERLKPWDRTAALAALRADAADALDDADVAEDDQILAWALEEDVDAPDGY